MSHDDDEAAESVAKRLTYEWYAIPLAVARSGRAHKKHRALLEQSRHEPETVDLMQEAEQRRATRVVKRAKQLYRGNRGKLGSTVLVIVLLFLEYARRHRNKS